MNYPENMKAISEQHYAVAEIESSLKLYIKYVLLKWSQVVTVTDMGVQIL